MRLRKTLVCNEKTTLHIIMDERVDHIDEKTIRVIICAVEIPETVKLDEIKEGLNTLKIRTDGKLHFTDIKKPDDRHKLVEYISKLSVRCKIYTYYKFCEKEQTAKKNTLEWATKHLMHSLSKQHKLIFLIEDAVEYKSLIKNRNITQDPTLTILPDTFCFIFAMRLDIARDRIMKEKLIKLNLLDDGSYNEATNIEWYNRLSDKIRLEAYNSNGCIDFASRGSKLKPILV